MHTHHPIMTQYHKRIMTHHDAVSQTHHDAVSQTHHDALSHTITSSHSITHHNTLSHCHTSHRHMVRRFRTSLLMLNASRARNCVTSAATFRPPASGRWPLMPRAAISASCPMMDTPTLSACSHLHNQPPLLRQLQAVGFRQPLCPESSIWRQKPFQPWCRMLLMPTQTTATRGWKAWAHASMSPWPRTTWWLCRIRA
jgi:hypothetical protein